MNIYKNTLKVHISILLNLYRNYCLKNSPNGNEFSKEIGDKIEFLYERGFLMAYAMGVTEVCKSVVFTKKKINELKKISKVKSRKKKEDEYLKYKDWEKIILEQERNKIENKLLPLALKIIEQNVEAFKNNKALFKELLERHQQIINGFFYITSTKNDFRIISKKYSNMNINKIRSFFSHHLDLMISRFKKRFDDENIKKNPYSMFVQPYEEPYVKIYHSEELKEMYLENTPYTIKGYAQGIEDTYNLHQKGKFFLLSTILDKNISFKEKSITLELQNYKKNISKHKI